MLSINLKEDFMTVPHSFTGKREHMKNKFAGNSCPNVNIIFTVFNSKKMHKIAMILSD